MSTAASLSSLPSIVSNEKDELNVLLCDDSELNQTIEVEALAAIREIGSFVQSICMSEVLTRTPQLLFLNLVILEDKCYCIELTKRGWRICSERQDCMYGDFRQLDLFTRYFETIYQLLDQISPEFRKKFSEAIANKLNQLVE